MTTPTHDQSPNSDPSPEPNPDPEPTPIAARVAANRWRNSAGIRERLVKVAGLRQRGLSQAAIAGRLGVSEATISRDLRRLPLLWRQEHAHFVNAERLRIFAGLREAERLWWEAIGKPQEGRDPVALLNSATGSFTAIAREIRMLLKHVRPPQPDDYWGYEAPRSPLRSRDALEERYEPPAKVVAGLLPYEDDPPDDDPKLAEYRGLDDDLMDLQIAVEADVAPDALERRLKDISSRVARMRQEQDGDAGGARRNGASGQLPYDW